MREHAPSGWLRTQPLDGAQIACIDTDAALDSIARAINAWSATWCAEFTSPLASTRFQALDQAFAAFDQMEVAKDDAEDESIAWTDDELADLLLLTHV